MGAFSMIVREVVEHRIDVDERYFDGREEGYVGSEAFYAELEQIGVDAVVVGEETWVSVRDHYREATFVEHY